MGHTLSMLARAAFGDAALGRDLGLDAGALDSSGTLVGRLAAALDEPVGAADGLRGLLVLAQGPAQGVVGELERLVRLLRRPLRGGDRVARLALCLLRGREAGGQLVAAVARGEDRLLAADRGLAQGARGGVEDSAAARDGDARERLRDGFE